MRDADLLLARRHAQPHGYLGAHADNGSVVVRAFRPAAAQKTLPALKMEVVGLWQPSAVATDVTAELSAIDRSGAHIVFTTSSWCGRAMG